MSVPNTYAGYTYPLLNHSSKTEGSYRTKQACSVVQYSSTVSLVGGGGGQHHSLLFTFNISQEKSRVHTS